MDGSSVDVKAQGRLRSHFNQPAAIPVYSALHLLSRFSLTFDVMVGEARRERYYFFSERKGGYVLGDVVLTCVQARHATASIPLPVRGREQKLN